MYKKSLLPLYGKTSSSDENDTVHTYPSCISCFVLFWKNPNGQVCGKYYF